jgi:hypothetical protein
MTSIMRIGVVAAAAAAVVAITQVARDRSPASVGDRGGREFRTQPAGPPPASQPPVRVDSFVVQRVAQGSALGAPGDLLITFHGQGFTLTSRAPRLLVTPAVTLETTEVNRDGTELYVLVPRAQLQRLSGARFDSVVVANPGARQEGEFARASIRATAARLFAPTPGAAAVRLVYREGTFSREEVR